MLGARRARRTSAGPISRRPNGPYLRRAVPCAAPDCALDGVRHGMFRRNKILPTDISPDGPSTFHRQPGQPPAHVHAHVGSNMPLWSLHNLVLPGSWSDSGPQLSVRSRSRTLPRRFQRLALALVVLPRTSRNIGSAIWKFGVVRQCRRPPARERDGAGVVFTSVAALGLSLVPCRSSMARRLVLSPD